MTDPTTAAPAPAGLASRTFVGLLVAQFFAAFNDQAIHAAAMFFAINTLTLTEENAITLMPILFYAPWAVFCTIAGYFADRYSKRNSLVVWKVVEVGVTAAAAFGFWVGRNGDPAAGAWVLLGCVFLMGTHSAFFVPAKYGIMPQILPPDQLSKGNGILESLSFLAVILGTVFGGVLSYLYRGEEVVIGVVLFALALVGAAASFLVQRVPAADPTKPFPRRVYAPLVDNVRTLVRVPALRLVLMGLVFFTFVVAFMRAAVYMLGESQNPPWDELKTSVIVGTVALGIGLGSPLAGYLSGRRIELRLVLVGTVGMVFLLTAAALAVDVVPLLVGCIVGIGFFTGFYIVPLFTLLQHKAPKASKGDMIATSNCVNTVGAIAATVLFKLVVLGAHSSGLTPAVAGRTAVAAGDLTELKLAQGRAAFFAVTQADGSVVTGGVRHQTPGPARTLRRVVAHVFEPGSTGDLIDLHPDIPIKRPAGGPVRVAVTKYTLGGVTHFDLTPEGVAPTTDYDNRDLPRYLFLGAAILTLGMLLAILRPLTRVRREGGLSAPALSERPGVG